MNKQNVKIVIVEDDCFYGEILRKYTSLVTEQLVPGENATVVHYATVGEFLANLDPATSIFMLDHDLGLDENEFARSGLDLLKIIKEQCPGSGIIIVTNHSDYPTINKFCLQGADRYILKNQDAPVRIMTALRQLLTA